MNRKKQPIDEYTLAAFLSGSLPEDRRREVVAYLAENADARELLCMAHEALDAAEHPVAEPFAMPHATPEPAAPKTAAPVPRRAARPAVPRPALRRQRVRRFATAALMVAVLGIGLRVGLSLNDTDALRGDAEDDRLTVRVSTPALQFQWNTVEEAYYYRLVVWDVDAAEVVARHETKSTRLGRNDAFVLSLRHELKAERLYSARIEAVDVQNRLILRSDLVDFTLQE